MPPDDIMTTPDRTAELMNRLVLTREEVAELLSCKANTVKRLHELGYLPAVKIGRGNRWTPECVREYVEKLKTKL